MKLHNATQGYIVIERQRVTDDPVLRGFALAPGTDIVVSDALASQSYDIQRALNSGILTITGADQPTAAPSVIAGTFIGAGPTVVSGTQSAGNIFVASGASTAHFVSAIPESSVTGLVSDLASKQATVSIRGLYLKPTDTPDMNVNLTEGVMDLSGTNPGFLTYIAPAVLAVSNATAVHEKVAIVQLNTSTGTATVKYGALVALGAHTAAYPAADATHIILAYVGTAAIPITDTLASIGSTNILNSEVGR